MSRHQTTTLPTHFRDAHAALGVSRATADRHWAYARAWLHDRLSAGG